MLDGRLLGFPLPCPVVKVDSYGIPDARFQISPFTILGSPDLLGPEFRMLASRWPSIYRITRTCIENKDRRPCPLGPIIA